MWLLLLTGRPPDWKMVTGSSMGAGHITHRACPDSELCAPLLIRELKVIKWLLKKNKYEFPYPVPGHQWYQTLGSPDIPARFFFHCSDKKRNKKLWIFLLYSLVIWRLFTGELISHQHWGLPSDCPGRLYIPSLWLSFCHFSFLTTVRLRLRVENKPSQV